MNRLADALKVRSGEERFAALSFGIMLVVSAGTGVGSTGIDTLFYTRFGVSFLPVMYLILGPLMLVTSLAVTVVLGRVAAARLFLVAPLALALLLVVERAILLLDAGWSYPLIWQTKEVIISIQGIVTWGVAGLIADTRQAKRLFPLFGAGAILGWMLGGFLTPILVGWLRLDNLLLVWALALVVTFAFVRLLLGRTAALGAPSRRKRVSLFTEMQQGYRYVRRSPLMGRFAVSAVLFTILYFSLYFPFSKAATAQFADEEALAGFLGALSGFTSAATLVTSLLVANRLYARYGIMNMILVFPAIYFGGFMMLVVAIGVVPNAALVMFALLTAFRVVQVVWLNGVADAAWQASFNVVPPKRRDQTRAFFNGAPNLAGYVMTGVVLIVGEQALDAQQLFLVGLAAAALTTFIIWRAKRAYSLALIDALRTGQPQVFFSEEEPFGGVQRDAAATTTVVAAMRNPDPALRRAAAEVLGQQAAPEAVDALVDALGDDDPQVRAAALRALARAEAASALLDIAARLGDGEPDVRAQAVEALHRLAGRSKGLVAHVRPLLEDADPAVRAAAACALLRSGSYPEAEGTLAAMASSGDAPSRVHALTAFGRWGDPSAYETVRAALRDPIPGVRCAAASAFDRPNESFIEPLVRALGDDDRSVRTAAAAALGRIGPPALESTLAALSDPALEGGALGALAQLPVGRAGSAIRGYAASRALSALRYHDLWFHAAHDGDERRRLLADSLKVKAEEHAFNALRAASLLGDRDAIAIAIDNLTSRDPAQRANAMETLESIGEANLVRPLLRLWEPRQAEAPASDDWLSVALTDSDAWLRACAALEAGRQDDARLRAILDDMAQSDPDPVAREAAVSALKGGEPVDTLPTLSLMERILFLRRVSLFAELPPADLKHVAALADEQYFTDGETIAEQDQPGDEMYIVVSGEVRVLARTGDGPVTEIVRRTPGEVVGEMAIISREPRMASLVASGDVRLLSLNQPQFESILRERPETALAVMRVLCQRLKALPVSQPVHKSLA